MFNLNHIAWASVSTGNINIPPNDIDVVLVANQNSFHYQDAYYALKKGINVVLEKPTSTSFYNSKKLVDYALKKKLKISVVMQRRFDASSDYLKYLIQKKLEK